MFHKVAADGARRRGKSSPEAKQSAATVGEVELLVGLGGMTLLPLLLMKICTGVNIY